MRTGVLAQIAEIQELTHAELQERWRALHGAEPPTYNRSLLVKRLAYRIQELAYGGLPDVARAELRRHIQAEGLDTEAAVVVRLERRSRKNGMPVAGTRLIREWQGRRYEVTVVEGGFEYEGRRFRSLTAALRLNVHFHTLVLGGIYTGEGEEALFHELPAPTPDDLALILHMICFRLMDNLVRQGLLDPNGQSEADDHPTDHGPSSDEGLPGEFVVAAVAGLERAGAGSCLQLGYPPGKRSPGRGRLRPGQALRPGQRFHAIRESGDRTLCARPAGAGLPLRAPPAHCH